MRALPDDFDVDALRLALAEGWDIDVAEADYAPFGGGSYHWRVCEAAGAWRFATVDDLGRKPWLGATPDECFAGLRSAFDTAAALHADGLGFVVAPIPTTTGSTLHRAGPRYSVALFPHVAGSAGEFGRYEPEEREAVQGILAELHGARPKSVTARVMSLELPGGRELESALQHLDEPWTAGPLSEQARRVLADHAADLTELLRLAERLARALPCGDWVITHGEPHAGNVIRTGDAFALVDWDTVALAPRERDLWWFTRAGAGEPARYAEATGYEPDRAAVDFFRLTWDLADAAAFTALLRAPHRDTADTAKALAGLAKCVAIREQWQDRLT